MGAVKQNEPRGKLFFGLLAGSENLLSAVRERLSMDFSAIVAASPVLPFDQTDYYSQEMGEHLLRQWVATEVPIHVRELVAIKHYTNSLERLYAQGEKRQVNIDPGYLTLSKVVLATTKDYDHRIYIGRGIFEEVTLGYRRRSGYEPWPWTYPDYRTDAAKEFFRTVRESYARQQGDEATGK
jgi:hypothetical protein